VINIVPGGREIGAYLVQHRDVDKVAFTGSTAAGRRIAETCGRLLRPVTLELVGKSAAIVLDDADLDLAKIGNDLHRKGQQRRCPAGADRHHRHQPLPSRPWCTIRRGQGQRHRARPGSTGSGRDPDRDERVTLMPSGVRTRV
jgi:hypothetical protein